MADTDKARTWTTKTLLRQLIRYLAASELTDGSSIGDLVDSLKASIVEEEVGVDLDWGGS